MTGRLRRSLGFFLALALLAVIAWQIRRFLDRPPVIEVAIVERGDVERVLAVTGRIRPRLTNRLVPLVSGRLVELARAEGEAVAEGEVLARLDDRAARSALEQAEADLARELATHEQRRRDLRRSAELTEAGLQPPSLLEQDQLAVEAGGERIAQLREAVRESRVRLEDYLLRSPLDGYVLERPVDPGQTVGPNDIVYEIATTEEPWVEAEVDERYLGELRLGLPARVSPLSGRRDIYPAQVVYIGKQIDRLSGAGVVRLAFESEAPTFPVGLSLDVNLGVETHANALTVPRAAVSKVGGEAWVLAVEAGRAVRRGVEVIDWPADRLVVLSGLEAGERVVLEPRQVGEGSEVRTRETKDAL